MDAPIPDLGLVQHLARFDKALRLRWGRHQRCWLIELKAREREPAWLAERPSPLGNSPRAKDAWDSWKDGYIFVTKLAHPIRFPWAFIAEHLRHLTLEAHQAKDALLARLDAAEAAEEAEQKRTWARTNEAGAKELYDVWAWANKRQISTHVAGPNPREERRDGYVVFDRRTVGAG